MSFRLNPVSLPSGSHQDTMVEFEFASYPQFAIVRMIDTTQSQASALGVLHRSNLDEYIQDSPEGGYEYVDMTGIAVRFNKPEPHPGVISKNKSHLHLGLEPLARAQFRLHDRNARTKTTFQKFKTRTWYPVVIEDVQSGLCIEIERNKFGHVERIVHPGGLAIAFANTPEGLRLGMDVIGHDGTRQTLFSYKYDSNQRLTYADASAAESWSYTYSKTTLTSDNGLNTKTTHVFDDQGRVIRVDTGDSYKQGALTYHDKRKQLTVQHGTTDDEFEKLWFDDKDRQFMSANALGEIAYRQYDDDNLLTAEIDANGNATRYRYDTYGNISSLIDPEGRETFQAYDDSGNVITRKDAAGNAYRFTYDDNDRLIEMTDPLGHFTNIINNEFGQPTQMMRHDGLIEFRIYDDHHRLESLIDFNSAETRFAYDAFNRIKSITDPAGNVTQLVYVPTKGCGFNTPTRVVRPDGVETARDFTAAGRIEAVTDGEGRKTRYHYGPYNVLEAITDPRGNGLRFQYDSQERLICVTNQMGLHWTFERDPAGRVVRETDFDGRTLGYTYDGGGRVVRRDNPDGAFLEYDYDKSGLLLELRAQTPGQKPLTTRYGYDENGALIAATNADAKIELTRDVMGRITAETVNGITIESDIDCCGARSARRLGGQELTFAYDGMGGMVEWALAGHAPLRFERDKLRQELRRTNGKGFELIQSWDTVGQLTHQKSGDVAERAYQWSQAYEPMIITDQHWGQKRYDYDANGQIAQTTHGDGKVEGFTYTPDLNISGTGDTEKFQNWQTTAAGVVKLARGPNGEVVTLEHDACGRVVQRTVARNGFRPQTWRFGWNAQDQMVSAHCPDGDVWTYAYDPFGRRVSKSCTHTRVTFIWDGDVIAREITETRGTTQTVDWFFEPGSFRPLARLENGDLSFIINDHLGTPKEVVGGDGTLRWSADHDTWGKLRTRKTAPSASTQREDYWITLDGPDDGNLALDYAPNPNALYCPIRFQGQWEDGEIGLYYNRFRFYDQKLACYISRDPIGLRGGITIGTYVRSATSFVDAFGLAPTCCAPNSQRHDPCRIRANSRTKGQNTQIDPSVDVPADIDAIMSSGDFVPGRDITVNGRTYGSHADTGRLFPRSGDGFLDIDRAEFNLLGQLNSFGLEHATNWATNNPAFSNDPEKLRNLIELWRRCP